MFNLDGTPYSLSDCAAEQVLQQLAKIEERVTLLRGLGELTEQTLRAYYGEKRFEQVAESNAIEGNTLSVGETELAVLKGVTITGHDPAYARDAIALDKALTRIAEMARQAEPPTGIEQLHEIHSLLLGDRHGAGVFRRERVIIRGSRHTPPKTWEQVMSQMEQWEAWSVDNPSLPGPIRSIVLHAWLTHIHPYVDGNGRTARAIGNLELIRAGYPPIIIKRVERDRYLDALGESDEGGDIRSFLELVLDRVEGSLIGLEHSARAKQGYNPALERIRLLQEKQLKIWETSIQLLASIIEHNVLTHVVQVGGSCRTKVFPTPLDIQDYLELCGGRAVPRSWAFIIVVEVPGVPRLEKLAYFGHRSHQMFTHLERQGGPSLYWSSKNPSQFPKWVGDGANSPYAVEMTAAAGNGDQWFAKLTNETVITLQTTELAARVAIAIVEQVVPA